MDASSSSDLSNDNLIIRSSTECFTSDIRGSSGACGVQENNVAAKGLDGELSASCSESPEVHYFSLVSETQRHNPKLS